MAKARKYKVFSRRDFESDKSDPVGEVLTYDTIFGSYTLSESGNGRYWRWKLHNKETFIESGMTTTKKEEAYRGAVMDYVMRQVKAELDKGVIYG